MSATDLFPDAKPSPASLDEQIACVEREIRMRCRVYSRAVAEKHMTQAKADHELRCMRGVLDSLQSLKKGS